VQHLRAEDLDQRDVHARSARTELVDLPRACSVISRAACICAAESAIQF
jgi:hypothetical protein